MFLSKRSRRQKREKTSLLRKDDISDISSSKASVPTRTQNATDNSKFNTDNVTGIRCKGWPKVAQDFLHRVPGYSDMLKSMGFCLIAKCRPKGDPEIEWRISFSFAENFLVSYDWSQRINTLFAVFKLLVHIHVGMSQVISTYTLKTVVFWERERIGKDTLDRPHLFGMCLLGLFDSLLMFTSEGNLPLYFMPSVNLFENVPSEMLQLAALKLSRFRSRIALQPDHLGMLKDVSSTRPTLNSKFSLARYFAHNNVINEVNEYKFKDLGDLHADPDALLNIYLSYLVSGLNLVEAPKERYDDLLRQYMSRTEPQTGFFSFISTLHVTARKSFEVFGYNNISESTSAYMRLWGNKTDLFLLYVMEADDISYRMNVTEIHGNADEKIHHDVICPCAAIFHVVNGIIKDRLVIDLEKENEEYVFKANLEPQASFLQC